MANESITELVAMAGRVDFEAKLTIQSEVELRQFARAARKWFLALDPWQREAIADLLKTKEQRDA